MHILGIDPGTRNMGYAIISLQNGKISLVEAGLIKMKAEGLQFQIPQMIEAFDNISKRPKITSQITRFKRLIFRVELCLTILVSPSKVRLETKSFKSCYQ